MFSMSLVSIVTASPPQFRRRIAELIELHLAAMDYPASYRSQRQTLWLSTINHKDFRCHLALLHTAEQQPDIDDPSQRVVGVCFSFRGEPQNWWDQQVSRGLSAAGRSPQQVRSTLADYAELSEFHVSPRVQHQGIGRALLRKHLGSISQQHVLLSTPESPGENNSAWRLYRSMGFREVLRDFYFPADSRPFALLSKAL